MRYKPFLSHKREDAPDLQVLRDELVIRGAGGWQDTRELPLGQRWMAAFRIAIGKETGGFIWFGTRRALTSRTICRFEVPRALRRARRRNTAAYPVIPLFVDLRPEEDADAIKQAFGARRGQRLLSLQGVIREDGEDLASFSTRAARRYVEDLIRAHASDHLRVAITSGREPTGAHDLSIDWRRLLDDGRLTDNAALVTIVETLTDIRQALQAKSDCPQITVEPHVRVPLAALIGWEWNRVRPLRLTVRQPTSAGMQIVEDLDADPRRWGDPITKTLPGDGPAILALSIGKRLEETVERYAATQGAREIRCMYVPLDEFPSRLLSPEDICSLAQWTVDQLAELNDRGVESISSFSVLRRLAYASAQQPMGPGAPGCRSGTVAAGMCQA